MSNKQLRHCKGSGHEIGPGFEHIDSDFENNKTLTYLDCFFFLFWKREEKENRFCTQLAGIKLEYEGEETCIISY